MAWTEISLTPITDDTWMDIDSSGNPHFVYYDAGAVWWSKWNGSSWVTEQVTPDPSGINLNFCLDADDLPCVIHADSATNNCAITRRAAGGVWTKTVIDTSQFTQGEGRIVKGPDDLLHVVYHADVPAELDLRYVQETAKDVWAAGVAVDTTGNTGHWPMVAVDSGNEPHVIYYNQTTEKVMCISRVAGVWQAAVEIGDSDNSEQAGIAVDSVDDLHVAYWDTGTNGVYYKKRTSGVWGTATLLGATDGAGIDVAIDIDIRDNPHVAWIPYTAFYYAAYNGSSWSAAELISGDRHNYVVLKVLDSGYVWLGVRDYTPTPTEAIARYQYLIAPPVVTITATDAVASESGSNNGEFTVSITRNGAVGAIVVAYTVSGSATPGVDYTALSGSVTILAGQNSATIPVVVISDSTYESIETVIATLSEGSNYDVGSPSSATVTITDQTVYTFADTPDLTYRVVCDRCGWRYPPNFLMPQRTLMLCDMCYDRSWGPKPQPATRFWKEREKRACDRCGLTYYLDELVDQDGYLVCTRHCLDERN